MLPLTSPEWAHLTDAYGSAKNIPTLLGQLTSYPPSDGHNEPWHSLWSALCHQGSIYPASFAAVPYIVLALEGSPRLAGFDYFALPVAVEIARVKDGVSIPPRLASAYQAAIRKLPKLALAAIGDRHERELVQSAIAAFAVGAGEIQVAELLFEVDPGDISEVLEWYENR